MLSAIWILNGLAYPQFYVHLHHILSVLPAVKALNLSVSAYFWETAKVTFPLPDWLRKCELVFSVLNTSLFCVVTALVASGFGVLCDAVDVYQFLEILVVSLSIGNMFAVMSLSSDRDFLLAIGIFTIVLVSYFLRRLAYLLQAALQLYRTAENDIVRRKAKLLANFGLLNLIGIALIILAGGTAFAFEFWNSTRILIMEGVIFLLYVNHLALFAFRDRVKGDARNEGSALVVLAEPDYDSGLAFLL
jgi:hypothetical protein